MRRGVPGPIVAWTSAERDATDPHKLPALKAENLPRCRARSCCGEGRQASAKLGETHEPKHWQSKRLTLELSGGAAVRLNEMLDGCDEVRWGEAVGLDERRTMSSRPHKLPALKAEDLPRRCAKCRCGDGRQASAKLGETHATKNQHELPPNAGVKRRRSRPP